MFAMAIWDARQRRLVLARDRLGKKPLVYRHEPGRLSFASELKSLLEIPGVPREIDPRRVDEYLTYQYVPHPRTIFRGIRKLPPGHWRFSATAARQVRPTGSRTSTPRRPLPEAEAIERLRETLESAVGLRLQSDVPLGAFLSGGVDSSLVVGLMPSELGAGR